MLRLLGLYNEFTHIPCMFDTDVNAPALAEYSLHKKESTSSCAYITVGTGVGVGLVVNNCTVKGLVHPEAGHLLVRVKPNDTFVGNCMFHGQCIEGMIATGALCARCHCNINDLPNINDDHELWDIVAYYIGQLCCNLILMVSPEHISIGGGVLNRLSLYPKIRVYIYNIYIYLFYKYEINNKIIL